MGLASSPCRPSARSARSWRTSPASTICYCGAAKGDKTPRNEDDIEKAAKTKADIVKALNESLVYCDAAFASLTDANAAESVDMPFGQRKAARVTPLLGNVGHLNEHYGNLVTYFRVKGMVPPSSKR